MRWLPRKYTCLADAAQKTGDERYRGGSVGIWYARPAYFRDLILGCASARKQGVHVTRATLATTHVFLGNIEADDPQMAIGLMLGDYWSPHGEAKEWLESIGASHTSMCSGDVIDFRGRLLFVDVEGFTELEDA
jgi:hypothetical protein